MKEGSDAGASWFSDDVEKKFQEKKKGKFAKLNNVTKKGLNWPQEVKSNPKGKKIETEFNHGQFIFLILFMGHFHSSTTVVLYATKIFYELVNTLRFKERNTEISIIISRVGIYYA